MRPIINQTVVLAPRLSAIDRIITAHPISITNKTINIIILTL